MNQSPRLIPNYFENLSEQISHTAKSLPDFLDPAEKQKILKRIESLQEYCTLQMQDMKTACKSPALK